MVCACPLLDKLREWRLQTLRLFSAVGQHLLRRVLAFGSWSAPPLKAVPQSLCHGKCARTTRGSVQGERGVGGLAGGEDGLAALHSVQSRVRLKQGRTTQVYVSRLSVNFSTGVPQHLAHPFASCSASLAASALMVSPSSTLSVPGSRDAAAESSLSGAASWPTWKVCSQLSGFTLTPMLAPALKAASCAHSEQHVRSREWTASGYGPDRLGSGLGPAYLGSRYCQS